MQAQHVQLHLRRVGCNALTQMVEEKLGRSGALAVEIQEMKNDLDDSAEALEYSQDQGINQALQEPPQLWPQ